MAGTSPSSSFIIINPLNARQPIAPGFPRGNCHALPGKGMPYKRRARGCRAVVRDVAPRVPRRAGRIAFFHPEYQNYTARFSLCPPFRGRAIIRGKCKDFYNIPAVIRPIDQIKRHILGISVILFRSGYTIGSARDGRFCAGIRAQYLNNVQYYLWNIYRIVRRRML